MKNNIVRTLSLCLILVGGLLQHSTVTPRGGYGGAVAGGLIGGALIGGAIASSNNNRAYRYSREADYQRDRRLRQAEDDAAYYKSQLRRSRRNAPVADDEDDD